MANEAGLKIEDYGQLEQAELLLMRPALTFGSCEKILRPEVVFRDGFLNVEMIENSPGNLQAFREMLTNAIDNNRRAIVDKVKYGKIEVNIDEENAIISISNGGSVPPLGLTKSGVHLPQMIFGVFNSGSNYTKHNKYKLGGLNGWGIKSVNLFSKYFMVEIHSVNERKCYQQEWKIPKEKHLINLEEKEANLKRISSFFSPREPKITDWEGGESRIQVICQLNNVLGLPINGNWYAFDCLMATIGNDISLTINDKSYDLPQIELKDFLKYFPKMGDTNSMVEEIIEEDQEKDETEDPKDEENDKPDILEEEEQDDLKTYDQKHRRKTKQDKTKAKKKVKKTPESPEGPQVPTILCHWKDEEQGFEIVVADIHEKFPFPKVFGWVNGLCCHEGVHVKSSKTIFCNAIVKKLEEKYRDKIDMIRNNKGSKFPTLIKENLLFLIKVDGYHPRFGAQTKNHFDGFNYYTGEKDGIPQFSKIPLDLKMKDPVWNNFEKSHLMTLIKRYWSRGEEAILSGTDGKKSRMVIAKNYDRANWSGGPKSNECSLFIVEGSSAATYPLTWMQYYGKQARNIYGIFRAKGKIINAMNATFEDLAENTELNELKKILGLREGINYENDENFNTLNYGKVYLLMDSDDDGIHIKYLFLNYFYTRYPSLISRGYVQTFLTCAVRVAEKDLIHRFYRFETYLHWLSQDPKRAKLKTFYFKGLGSCTPDDIRDDYQVNRQITFELGDDHREVMELAFNSTKADDRKNWILSNAVVKQDYILSTQTLRSYLENEATIFWLRTLTRAIPHFADGLKYVQRILVYGAYNQKEFIKTGTLAEKISSDYKYHHGDMSIKEALIKLSQNFVGTGSITLFTGKGNMGTRNEGGQDHAAARYTSIKINPLVKYLFPEDDFPLHKLREEEGKTIEPEHLYGVIPLALCMNVVGIASGWSSTIPSFNPYEIIANIRRALQGKKMKKIVPFYPGFTGHIIPENGTYTCEALYEENRTTWKINELPIGKWTNRFREKVLDNLLERGWIKDYDNHSDTKTVSFTIRGINIKKMRKEYGKDAEEIKAEKAKKDDKKENEDDEEYLVKRLGLKTTISTRNMVLLKDGLPVTYNNPLDIISDYVAFRLPIYVDRKKYQIEKLRNEIEKLRQKIIVLKLIKAKKIDFNEDLEEACIEQDDTLTYPILKDIFDHQNLSGLRKSNIENLIKKSEKLKEELESLEKVSATDLWLKDLDALEKKLPKY